MWQGTWQFMSVKALDDGKKEIELSDELESVLHVLVYEASRYIKSNLSSVEGFVSAYFNGSHQSKLEFYCGQLKRSSITSGTITRPDGGALLFLRSDTRAYRPLPSRTRTKSAQPLCQSDGALPTSSESVEGEKAVPGDKWHPIQAILQRLLRLFRHHYIDHVVSEGVASSVLNADTVEKEAERDDDSDDYDDYDRAARATYIKVFSSIARAQDVAVAPRAATTDNDMALKTHTAFAAILFAHYDEESIWDPNDKLPDQVDPTFGARKRAAKVTKEDLVAGLAEEDEPKLKRQA